MVVKIAGCKQGARTLPYPSETTDRQIKTPRLQNGVESHYGVRNYTGHCGRVLRYAHKQINEIPIGGSLMIGIKQETLLASYRARGQAGIVSIDFGSRKEDLSSKIQPYPINNGKSYQNEIQNSGRLGISQRLLKSYYIILL